ncbi:hypothetical protein ACFLX3_02000 [Chloroflexota bacterium]
MGRRDYRHRENKKVKKDTGKVSQIGMAPAPANVEVVGKGKKKREEEETAS